MLLVCRDRSSHGSLATIFGEGSRGKAVTRFLPDHRRGLYWWRISSFPLLADGFFCYTNLVDVLDLLCRASGMPHIS